MRPQRLVISVTIAQHDQTITAKHLRVISPVSYRWIREIQIKCGRRFVLGYLAPVFRVVTYVRNGTFHADTHDMKCHALLLTTVAPPTVCTVSNY